VDDRLLFDLLVLFPTVTLCLLLLADVVDRGRHGR
jgi:hypothetical protein